MVCHVKCYVYGFSQLNITIIMLMVNMLNQRRTLSWKKDTFLFIILSKYCPLLSWQSPDIRMSIWCFYPAYFRWASQWLSQWTLSSDWLIWCEYSPPIGRVSEYSRLIGQHVAALARADLRPRGLHSLGLVSLGPGTRRGLPPILVSVRPQHTAAAQASYSDTEFLLRVSPLFSHSQSCWWLANG